MPLINNTRHWRRFGAASCLLLFITSVSAQEAGDSVTLQYGTVQTVEQVKAETRHARGATLGGIGGAIIADDHPGLGALAGGLIGGGIQGARTNDNVLQQYTVRLLDGSDFVIDTEQHDIVAGDCVVIEQGKYANIRRVSSVNCEVSQEPEHHKEAASNCQKAKDELAAARTSEAVEIAVTKVRTLCED